MTRGKFKKSLLFILACTLYYTFVGFIALPFIIKTLVVFKLPDFINREVSIHKVKINPYALTFALEGLIIKEKSGELLTSINGIYINIQGSSLIKKALVVKEFHLSGPYVGIVRHSDNTFNFSDLIPEQKAPDKEEDTKGSPPPPFILDKISITDGNFYFRDEKMNKEYTITEIQLFVPFLSSLPGDSDEDVLPYFSAYLNGEPLEFKGKTRPFNKTRQRCFFRKNTYCTSWVSPLFAFLGS